MKTATTLGPCREYQGPRFPKGYGRKTRTGVPGGTPLHRWIVEQIEGPLAPGEVVRHRCDNPPCFRYDHLVRGTQVENMGDAVERGRHRMGRKPGASNAAAVLTVDQVADIRRRYPSESQVSLGRTFGVAANTIGRIVRGETWQ